ncbi:hypothetical protein AGMMS49975_14460 [Clostridia bacterium]|nr:hypothetical protein AGMMS49975_14460 [Clostridia bacterium]
MKLSDFLGNNLIKERILKTVKDDRATHAYLFTGAFGAGKFTLCGIFAKALNCASPKNGEPCGVCHSCVLFEAGNHPDVFYAAPAKDRKTIGVSDIREQVAARIEEKPFNHRYKIFIIRNSDTMTLGAQNALLKMLEEPAEYAVFLLTAENPRKLLQTVLSRVISMPLMPLSAEVMKKYLKDAGLSSIETKNALFAGTIGKALALCGDTEFSDMREFCENLVKSGGITAAEGFSLAKRAEEFKTRANEMLDVLYILYARDIRDAVSRNVPVPLLVEKAQSVQKAQILLSQNANFAMVWDNLLITLIR